MECNEGSKSFVDVDGIRYSFDNSIHVSSSDGPRTEITVSFLASASRGDANPQSKDDIEQSFLHATGHSERNDRDVGPSGSSESIPQMVKLAFPQFPVFSIGPLRPLLQELYLQLHKHPLQQKLGNLPPQVTLSPVWICWR